MLNGLAGLVMLGAAIGASRPRKGLGAITHWDGTKSTPKDKAQDLLMDAMLSAVTALHDENDSDPYTGKRPMTPSEVKAVETQLIKQKNRVVKLFGYPPGGWDFH
jgi:hypothetical protein